MSTAPRIAELTRGHRARLAEILVATNVFRDEEIGVALELFDETFPHDGTPGHDTAVVSTSPASSSDYAFLGAFTPEDELVGYACYGPTPATDGTFDLYWIAVHPAGQSSGSGTTLLAEVERRIAGHDGRLLVVETSSRSDYQATRGFYAARGYAEVARVADFYAPADDRIILTKRLQAARDGRGASSR